MTDNEQAMSEEQREDGRTAEELRGEIEEQREKLGKDYDAFLRDAEFKLRKKGISPDELKPEDVVSAALVKVIAQLPMNQYNRSYTYKAIDTSIIDLFRAKNRKIQINTIELNEPSTDKALTVRNEFDNQYINVIGEIHCQDIRRLIDEKFCFICQKACQLLIDGECKSINSVSELLRAHCNNMSRTGKPPDVGTLTNLFQGCLRPVFAPGPQLSKAEAEERKREQRETCKTWCERAKPTFRDALPGDEPCEATAQQEQQAAADAACISGSASAAEEGETR